MKRSSLLVILTLLATSFAVPSSAVDYSCLRPPQTVGMGSEPVWTTSASKDLKFLISWSFSDPENCIIGMPSPGENGYYAQSVSWASGNDLSRSQDFEFPTKWTVTRDGEMALVTAETELPIELLLSFPNRNLDGNSMDLNQRATCCSINTWLKVRKPGGFGFSQISGRFGLSQLWGTWFSKNQGLHNSECKPITPEDNGYVKANYELSYKIIESGLNPVVEISIDEPSKCIFLIHSGPLEQVKRIANSGSGGYLAEHPFWSGEAPTYFNSILNKPDQVLQIGTGDFTGSRYKSAFLYRDENILEVAAVPKQNLSHFDKVSRVGNKVIITTTIDGSQINPEENGSVSIYTGFYSWYSKESSFVSGGWKISFSRSTWTARYSSGGWTDSGLFMSYTTDAIKIPISDLFLSPEAKADAKSSDAKAGDQLSQELADFTLKEFSDLVAQQEADAKAAAAKTYKSKISILCAKGSSVKKVTALKPKCPPGFKQKPTKK